MCEPAQALFGLVIFGIGIIIGSVFAGYVGEWARIDGAMNYTRLFSVPMWIALGCLAALLAFYPRHARRPETHAMAAAA